jgi:hypothetical protein
LPAAGIGKAATHPETRISPLRIPCSATTEGN